MKLRLTLIFLLFSLCNLNSQSWDWGRSSGGGGGGPYAGQEGCYVATDNKGGLYFAGEYSTTCIIFDTVQILSANYNYFDAFVGKYDSIGNFEWLIGIKGYRQDEISSICADRSGNVLVTGYTQSSSLTIGNFNLNIGDSTYQHFFLIKLDENGNLSWVKTSSTLDYSVGVSVCCDDRNNIYVGGILSGPGITFDTIYLDPNNGGSFLAKFDSTGQTIWAINHPAYSCSVVRYDNVTHSVFITGGYGSVPLTIGNQTFPVPGANGIYISRFSENGVYSWTKVFGGVQIQVVSSCDIDKKGNILLGGYFNSPTLTFGSHNLYLPSAMYDGFLVKLDTSGTPVFSFAISGSNTEFIQSVSCDDADNFYLTCGYRSNDLIFVNNVLPSNGTDPLLIAKYNSSGDVVCYMTLPSGGDDYSTVVAGHDGHAYLGGDFLTSYLQIGPDLLIHSCQENAFIAKFNCGCGVVQTTPSSNVDCGESLLLNVTNAYSVHWDSSITLSCQSCSSVLATPNSTARYCAQIIDTSGCYSTSCIVVGYHCDKSPIIPTLLYEGQLFEIGFLKSNTSLKIFDSRGRLIYDQMNYTNDWSIELANGIYEYVLHEDSGKIYSGKFGVVR